MTDIRNMKIVAIDDVYSPREDSYLLANAVKIPSGAFVLDLGCGSGIQTINALIKGAEIVLAVDIDEDALMNVKMNAVNLGLEDRILIRASNLFDNITEKFDVIIFNPPYLVSEKIEDEQLDGGEDGRELLDAFLEDLPDHLKTNGICYFLQNDINDVEKTQKKLDELGFNYEIVAQEKIFFEELYVFKCWEKK